MGICAFSETGLECVKFPRSLRELGGDAFGDCKDLKYIELNEGLTEIPVDAFMGTGIKELKIPDSVETIHDSAFYDCKKLESIEFGTNLTKIGSYAFSSCGISRELKFPESLQGIGESAFKKTRVWVIDFRNCTKLDDIGRDAFEDCKYLTRVYGLPEKCSLLDIFMGCDNLSIERIKIRGS